MKKEKLIVCGDVHGKLSTLVWKLAEQYKYTNVDVLILGDLGAGFGRPKSLDVMYSSIKKRLESRNIDLYTIRGNHDNPDFFNGTVNFPKLHLIPDHTVIELCGFTIYPIGGGTSEDQEFRKKYNKRYQAYGSEKRIWWEGERPTQIFEPDLPLKVDIIASHIAPISFRPIAEKIEDVDPPVWDMVVEDRTYLEHVLNETRAAYWFYGHYHKSQAGEFGSLIYRCLGELELLEVEKREI